MAPSTWSTAVAAFTRTANHAPVKSFVFFSSRIKAHDSIKNEKNTVNNRNRDTMKKAFQNTKKHRAIAVQKHFGIARSPVRGRSKSVISDYARRDASTSSERPPARARPLPRSPCPSPSRPPRLRHPPARAASSAPASTTSRRTRTARRVARVRREFVTNLALAIEHDGACVSETNAIARYLCAAFPERRASSTPATPKRAPRWT